MHISEKYIRRGIRTASRIYNNKAIVIILSLGRLGGKNNGLYILSNEGTLLWKLLDESHQVKEVMVTMARLKKIQYAKIERKLITYIRELAKNHIVDIIDKPRKEYY